MNWCTWIFKILCWCPYFSKLGTSLQILSHITLSIQRQCLWCCHHGRAIARVHPVHLMNVEPKTKPDDLGCESAYTYYGLQVYTHHRHLLLLLSPKADTHFTVPRRVEGRVDLVDWYIPRWFTRPQTVTHPGTNRVWCSATTLIEANALPLSQTANGLLSVSRILRQYTLSLLLQTYWFTLGLANWSQ